MSVIGWTLDLWDDGNGLRLKFDAESTCLEFGLLFSKDRAEEHELLDHCVHGDSSAHCDVTALDPECEVYLFGGLPNREVTAQWLRKALALVEATE
jgi:hypothetical protein